MKRLTHRYAKASRPSPTIAVGSGSGAETVPTAFSFVDVTGAVTNTVTTSAAITIIGLGAGIIVPVTITGGGTYSKNAGGFTAAEGTAVNGDSFTARITSSASAATTVSTQLYVGGRSDTFSVTTA